MEERQQVQSKDENLDAGIIGFFKATGLWDESRSKTERFWGNLLILVLGFLSLFVLHREAAVVIAGILPVFLLVLGGYGMLTLLLSTATGRSQQDTQSLLEEIRQLRKEVEELRKQAG